MLFTIRIQLLLSINNKTCWIVIIIICFYIFEHKYEYAYEILSILDKIQSHLRTLYVQDNNTNVLPPKGTEVLSIFRVKIQLLVIVNGGKITFRLTHTLIDICENLTECFKILES